MARADRKATRSSVIEVCAKALGRGGDLAPPVGLAAERPEGGQSLHQVEEAGREGREPPPLAVGLPAGLSPEVDHGQRHQHHHPGQDQHGDPVLPAHPGQDGDRCQAGQHRLGEVAAEVGIEGGDAAGGGERELPGALLGPATTGRGRGSGAGAGA